MNEEIIPTLSHYIAAEFLKQPKRIIDPYEPLISSGLVTSMDLVDLSLFVEDRFGVQIDDTELNTETFDTLNELAVLIRQRQ